MKAINTYIIEKLKIGKSTKYKSQYNYFPKDVNELREILVERLAKDKDADLNDIDVSKIDDMVYRDPIKQHDGNVGLFFHLDPHNIDISQWDVSNVKYMGYMFYRCKNLDCDLSGWDVSNVKDMEFMFAYCENFDCDLSDWDVSNVRDVQTVFHRCNKLKNKPSWYKDEET